ncbi:TPA: CPBP family intramembrane metalloprotease [Klebsiella pneumoniae]|nr:putative membrane-bound protease [Klebsiella pneumoniae]HBR1042133.1 CPBP family intramembrane metalloprotease [Klebsiella pneumoniae]HBR1052802.1 CPBP family intramembrane metalloprotease [Klebsiella pneumoniae]
MFSGNKLIVHALVFATSVALTGVPLLTIPRIGLEYSLYLLFSLEFALGLGVGVLIYKGNLKITKIRLLLNCLVIIMLLQLFSYILKTHSIGSASLSIQNLIPYFFTILIIPFYEEIFYRGCLFDFLRGLYTRDLIFPSVMSSVVFCVMHTQYTELFDYVIIFAISMVLTFSRIKSDGLSTPILLHSSMNAFVIILNIQSMF